MSWIDQLPEDIRESLPEDIRANETLNRYNSIEDLAKGHIETKAAFGQSIRIPPDEAGEEARAQFLQKLKSHVPELVPRPSIGQPESFDEFYSVIGVPKDFSEYENPEGVQLKPEAEASLREVMHGAKLTPEQYKFVVQKFSEMDAKAQENMTKAFQSDMDKLKGEWGATYDERTEAAKKAAAELYPGRDFDTFSPDDLRALYRHQVAVTGGKPQAATQDKSETGKLTPQEALRRANEIMDNPAYWDKSNPQKQQDLIKRRLELLEMAGFNNSLDQLRAPSF